MYRISAIIEDAFREYLPLAIKRAQRRVSLAVTRAGIVIRDDGVALSPAAARELAGELENVTVKSRVGFGTEVRIKFA